MCFFNYLINHFQYSFKVLVPISNLNIRRRYLNKLVTQCSHFSRNLKRSRAINSNLRYLSFLNKIILVHNRNGFVIITAQLQQEIPQVVNRVL